MKKGLVMEGGAMRGLFTCGVIDVFLENEIRFDGAVGISAGAVFGSNYKSRQPGRPLRYNTRFCTDWRYGTFRSFLKSGDLFDATFCYDTIPNELDVFDAEAFAQDPMPFYVGATDCQSGKCRFHECRDGQDNDMAWMRASASMPLVSRVVEVDGLKLLDGGIADSIPLRFMEDQGYERNVVITTQPKGFTKGPNKAKILIAIALRKYPELVRAMQERPDMYNEEVAYLEKREAEGAAFVIRPPRALGISRIEKDPQELRRVYELGHQEALNDLSALQTFLDA